MTLTETDEQSQPLCSITFRLSLQDVQMLAARPAPLPQRLRMSIVGAWVVTCFLIGLRDDAIAALMPWAGEMRLYVAVGVVTAMCYLLQMAAAQVLTNARVRQARAPSTDTSIDIWDNHFAVRLDGSTGTYAWSELNDIGLEGDGLTWYMVSGDMLYIPQSAFKDRQAMLDFNLEVDNILRQIDDND